MKQNGEIAQPRSSRFRTLSVYGFWVVLLWASLGGGLINLAIGLGISWLILGIGMLLIILPFTPPFQTYIRKPIDSRVYPISVFAGYISLIILYGVFMLSYATDPYVLVNPINKAGMILWAVATFLSIAGLCTSAIGYIMDRRAQKVNLPSE